MVQMIIEYFIQIAPVLVIIIIYFVRLEIRLAKICESLKWIRRELNICRPPLDNDSQ